MSRIMPEPAEVLALGVLASGRGSNYQSVQDGIDAGEIPAQIKVVISDKAHAPVLERARKRGIEAVSIPPGAFADKASYEAAVVDILKQHGVELVVLAGYMRIVGDTVLAAYPMRVINIHPALLPAFPGLHAQRQALDYGVRVSGCTVHFVDRGVDTGPVILQTAVPVEPGDDEDTLAARILVEEHKLLPKAVRLIAEGRLYIEGRKVRII